MWTTMTKEERDEFAHSQAAEIVGNRFERWLWFKFCQAGMFVTDVILTYKHRNEL